MEELSKKIITGKYEPLPTSTSPELQRLVRRLLALEPKARPDINELLGMQVVQDHMNLLPSVPKSSRLMAAHKPQQEFMDLRNTIHTPRRMNDMKHLLPSETRYDEETVKGRTSQKAKSRRRVHSHPTDRGEQQEEWHLPPLQPSSRIRSERGIGDSKSQRRLQHQGLSSRRRSHHSSSRV